MNEAQLKIVISAIDNASATLKSMAANAESANAQASGSADKAGLSFGSLVGGILSAQLAYGALTEAAGAIKGFFQDSAEQAIEASATLARVKNEVDNAGLSYADLGPKIDAVAQAHVALGFADDDTADSMGKLLLATGDYSQALRLNQLAMDLSRAKGLDLNTSTVLLEQVMAGNTRVLKSYGISLDGASTSADVLNLLQSKLQGSSAAFANTSAGQMAIMQAQWQGLEQTVGQAFMPILEEVFSSFEGNMPAITASLVEMGTQFATIVEDIIDIGKESGVFHVIAVELGNVYDYVKFVASAIDTLAVSFRLLAGTEKEYVNAQQDVSDGQQKILDEWNQMHSKAQITTDQWKQMDEQVKLNVIHSVQAAEKTGALASATGAAGNTFDDVTNRIKAADNAVVKHSDAVAQLATEYDKMKDQGETDLADLADAFTTKMDSINKTIADTQQKITDLTTSYADQQKDDTASVADSIVASEKKIADIKTQLQAATTDSERASLQKQLTAEQSNYDSSLAFRQTHLAEMSAAEAKASLTDLQRTIADYNTKEAKATEAYNKQLATLNATLKATQDEADAETKLYHDKVDQINKILDAGNAYFDKLSADRVQTTTNEVQAEIKQFQALASAITGTKGANPTSISTINIPKLAAGGIVNGPTLAMIGEAGPEAVVPLSGGYGNAPVISSLSASGGSQILIQVLGGTYLDRDGAGQIATALARQVQTQLKLKRTY